MPSLDNCPYSGIEPDEWDEKHLSQFLQDHSRLLDVEREALVAKGVSGMLYMELSDEDLLFIADSIRRKSALVARTLLRKWSKTYGDASTWTCQDVLVFLRLRGLSDLCDRFQKARVDGTVLCSCDAASLENTFDISEEMVQNKVLRDVRVLRGKNSLDSLSSASGSFGSIQAKRALVNKDPARMRGSAFPKSEQNAKQRNSEGVLHFHHERLSDIRSGSHDATTVGDNKQASPKRPARAQPEPHSSEGISPTSRHGGSNGPQPQADVLGEGGVGDALSISIAGVESIGGGSDAHDGGSGLPLTSMHSGTSRSDRSPHKGVLSDDSGMSKKSPFGHLSFGNLHTSGPSLSMFDAHSEDNPPSPSTTNPSPAIRSTSERDVSASVDGNHVPSGAADDTEHPMSQRGEVVSGLDLNDAEERDDTHAQGASVSDDDLQGSPVRHACEGSGSFFSLRNSAHSVTFADRDVVSSNAMRRGSAGSVTSSVLTGVDFAGPRGLRKRSMSMAQVGFSTRLYMCDDLVDRLRRHKIMQSDTKFFVWLPDSPSRQRWDFFMLLLVLYNGMVVPVRAGFGAELDGPLWTFADYAGLVCFLLDMVLNFRTAYRETSGPKTGCVIKDPRCISRHYLRTWFFLDFISSVPLDVVVQQSQGWNRLLRTARLFKLMRLMRMSRIMERLEMSNTVPPAVFRLTKLLLALTFVWHWIACIYWYIAKQDGFASEDAIGWAPEEELEYAELSEQYFAAMLWAITTTTGIGASFAPQTTQQRLFTIAVVVMGVLMLASIIGGVTSALQNIDDENRDRQQHAESLALYMRQAQIKPELQREIRDYYMYLWSSPQVLKERSFLDDLHPALQAQLSLATNRPLLEQVPMFQDVKADCLMAIADVLESRIYLPGEFIVIRGEQGDCMFFIVRGQVEVLDRKMKHIATMENGDFFGEQVLLRPGLTRSATIRSVSYCDIMVLQRDDFQDVVHQFPRLRAELEKHVQARNQRDTQGDHEGHKGVVDSMIRRFSLQRRRSDPTDGDVGDGAKLKLRDKLHLRGPLREKLRRRKMRRRHSTSSIPQRGGEMGADREIGEASFTAVEIGAGGDEWAPLMSSDKVGQGEVFSEVGKGERAAVCIREHPEWTSVDSVVGRNSIGDSVADVGGYEDDDGRGNGSENGCNSDVARSDAKASIIEFQDRQALAGGNQETAQGGSVSVGAAGSVRANAAMTRRTSLDTTFAQKEAGENGADSKLAIGHISGSTKPNSSRSKSGSRVIPVVDTFSSDVPLPGTPQ
eukprot:Rmarinus@m.18252